MTNTAPTERPQRGERGWFLPGNSVSRGHPKPHAAKVAAIRSIFFEELPPEDVRRIIRSLKVAAIGLFDREEGKWIQKPDVKAAEFLFDRTIGKPMETTGDERLKRLEESLGLDDALDPAAIASILSGAYEHGESDPPPGEAA